MPDTKACVRAPLPPPCLHSGLTPEEKACMRTPLSLPCLPAQRPDPRGEGAPAHAALLPHPAGGQPGEGGGLKDRQAGREAPSPSNRQRSSSPPLMRQQGPERLGGLCHCPLSEITLPPPPPVDSAPLPSSTSPFLPLPRTPPTPRLLCRWLWCMPASRAATTPASGPASSMTCWPTSTLQVRGGRGGNN